MSSRRIRLGRMQIYIEPRDIWVGAYVAPDAVYLCPLPLLVIKIERHLACFPNNPKKAPCTGLTARWCPAHGYCACPTEAPSTALAAPLNDPQCPLHGTASDHGERVAAPYPPGGGS